MASSATDPRSAAVLLSDAHEDTAVARRLADALRAAGVAVWFDESELRGRKAAPVATGAARAVQAERSVGAASPAKARRRIWPLIMAVVVAVVIPLFLAARKPAPPSSAAKPLMDFAAAKSIAVLPFVNMGADKADESLGDRMTGADS